MSDKTVKSRIPVKQSPNRNTPEQVKNVAAPPPRSPESKPPDLGPHVAGPEQKTPRRGIPLSTSMRVEYSKRKANILAPAREIPKKDDSAKSKLMDIRSPAKKGCSYSEKYSKSLQREKPEEQKGFISDKSEEKVRKRSKEKQLGVQLSPLPKENKEDLTSNHGVDDTSSNLSVYLPMDVNEKLLENYMVALPSEDIINKNAFFAESLGFTTDENSESPEPKADESCPVFIGKQVDSLEQISFLKPTSMPHSRNPLTFDFDSEDERLNEDYAAKENEILQAFSSARFPEKVTNVEKQEKKSLKPLKSVAAALGSDDGRKTKISKQKQQSKQPYIQIPVLETNQKKIPALETNQQEIPVLETNQQEIPVLETNRQKIPLLKTNQQKLPRLETNQQEEPEGITEIVRPSDLESVVSESSFTDLRFPETTLAAVIPEKNVSEGENMCKISSVLFEGIESECEEREYREEICTEVHKELERLSNEEARKLHRRDFQQQIAQAHKTLDDVERNFVFHKGVLLAILLAIVIPIIAYISWTLFQHHCESKPEKLPDPTWTESFWGWISSFFSSPTKDTSHEPSESASWFSTVIR